MGNLGLGLVVGFSEGQGCNLIMVIAKIFDIWLGLNYGQCSNRDRVIVQLVLWVKNK